MESSSSWLCYYLPQCNETAEVILMRTYCRLLLSSALVATIHSGAVAETDHADIKSEITKRHDEAVKRLQDWIGQVSIAAENRGYPEGVEYMAKLAREFDPANRDENID